jgi:hypothetical protein
MRMNTQEGFAGFAGRHLRHSAKKQAVNRD